MIVGIENDIEMVLAKLQDILTNPLGPTQFKTLRQLLNIVHVPTTFKESQDTRGNEMGV